MNFSIEFLSGITFIGVAGMTYYVLSKYKRPSIDNVLQNTEEELKDHHTDNQCFEAEKLQTTKLKSKEELYKDAVVENHTLRELQSKPDLTIEKTIRRLPLNELQQDPALCAAYVRGWEDGTADAHLNIRAWNPSLTHPRTTLTPLPHRQSHVDQEIAGCKINPEEKKLKGPATTSARETKRTIRKKKRDMARMAEFLARKRGQQTGPSPTI